MFFFGLKEEDLEARPELPAQVQVLLLSDGLDWGQIEGLLGTLRQRKPDMTVGALQVFLYIARRAALKRAQLPYVKTISHDLGIYYSTVARHCDILADGVGGIGGLGLIAKIKDPTSRVKYLTLTDEGIGILAKAVDNESKTSINCPRRSTRSS